jgi:4-hydroxy-3-methylbut-2-enyl diphosphate reductase
MTQTNQQLSSNQVLEIILAEPRGFCAGVNRAIEIVDLALERFGAPLYVRHEIVHNHHVVNDFKNRGVIFVESLEEIPNGALVIFSAHGTSPSVIKSASDRGLKFIDAVCPLVTKVHLEIARAIKDGKKVIYIGHRGHQEVLGAMGYAIFNLDCGSKNHLAQALKPGQDIYLVESLEDVENLSSILATENLVVATQTTLSLDDTSAIIEKLRSTFTKIEFPKSDDICYATQNRQDAVKELAKFADYILIIGSENSSNTLRLLELANKLGKPAELVPDPEQFTLKSEYYSKVIGISSGASAPEFLVKTLVAKLKGTNTTVRNLKFKEENIEFPLPKF